MDLQRTKFHDKDQNSKKKLSLDTSNIHETFFPKHSAAMGSTEELANTIITNYQCPESRKPCDIRKQKRCRNLPRFSNIDKKRGGQDDMCENKK